MADVLHDVPGAATAEGGIVFLEGPDGTSLSLSPSAARSTGENLVAAAEQAQLQSHDRK